MKKTIFTSIVLTSLTAGVLLFSCKKQESIQTQNPPNEVKNNLFVFKTTNEYRDLVDNSSPETMLKFTNGVKAMNNFTSYSKHFASKNPEVIPNKACIDNDFLQTILNEDAAVQIGDYIYKIDVEKGKVFALNTANANQYRDVVSGNINNANIRVFSISDDVLDLIEQQGQQTTGVRCSEEGIAGTDIYSGWANVTNASSQGSVQVRSQIHFNRYGLLFSLWGYGEYNLNGETGSNSIGQLYMDFAPKYYRVRCKQEAGPDYFNDYTNGNTVASLRYQSWQGSRTLSKVWFRLRTRMHVVTPSGAVIDQYTDWIEYRKNY